MKFYVAGLNFGVVIGSPIVLATYIAEHLDQIEQDASNTVGSDAIILIVLREYGLTFKAVSNKVKKDCLDLLSQALSHRKNMILIPGSMASYRELGSYRNPQQKLNQINNNYLEIYDSLHFKQAKECEQFLLKADVQSPQNLCLSNQAYILTTQNGNGTKKTKHHKSYPYNELSKLSKDRQSNSFFYCGNTDTTKQLALDTIQIELSLIICAEHDGIYINQKLVQQNPLIQVIISDSIPLESENLYGALNVHIDSKEGFVVYSNKYHPKYQQISAITACEYAFQISTRKFLAQKTKVKDLISFRYLFS